MKELRELIGRAKEIYPVAYPRTEFLKQESVFTFPSGARVEFGYCQSDDDLEQYRGQEYAWIGIDELTQFPTPAVIEKLNASLRTTDPGQPTYMRYTTNPTGVGRLWVKERFIDLGPAGKTIEINIPLGDDKFVKTTRKWLHSTIWDNPILLKNDPKYLANLFSRTGPERDAWVYGSWDNTEGLAFEEFKERTHVIEPFQIPSHWPRYRGCDWGYGRAKAVCLWIAFNPDDGTAYIYREFVANGNVAFTKKLTAPEFAKVVLEMERGETIRYGVIDSSTNASRGEVGPSIAEQMRKVGLGWRMADRSRGSRIARKQILHQYLAPDMFSKKPKLLIFNNCRQIIKELGSLPLDENNPEDVDTDAEDHCFDDQTEILTNEGWKLFKDLNRNETVATLSDTGIVEYQKPIDYIDSPYNGEMLVYDSNGISFATTPNHKHCVVSQYDYKIKNYLKYSLTMYDDLHAVRWIPRIGNSTRPRQETISIAGVEWDTDLFFWFIGFWLAEGCVNTGVKENKSYILTDQKKFTDEVRSKYAEFPVNWSEATNKHGVTRFSIHNKDLFEWFKEQGLASTLCDTKFIPRWMLEFHQSHLEHLYEALMLGDGCRTQHSWHYDTTSKQLADDFQELLFKIGKCGNIYYHTYYQKRNPKHKPQYRINIRQSETSVLYKRGVKKVLYSGRIYCVTVPKYHTIYVRRNGKPMWSGQSYDALTYILASRPKPTENSSDSFSFVTQRRSPKPTIVNPRLGF